MGSTGCTAGELQAVRVVLLGSWGATMSTTIVSACNIAAPCLMACSTAAPCLQDLSGGVSIEGMGVCALTCSTILYVFDMCR